MKIFITYASAGSGHFKAAQGIYNYFRQRNSDLELKLIDVLEGTNFFFRNSYTYSYTFLVSYAVWLWFIAFYATSLKFFQPLIQRINCIINRLNAPGFIKLLIRENPDFIISTHFLPSGIIAYLKKNHRINSQLVTVITDFGVHPYWVLQGTDIYVVALEATKEELIAQGAEENRIKVLGIPVDAKFLKQYNKDTLYKKFGLEKGKFTVLIITGSFGIGPIEEIVDSLHKDVRLLIVCAYNRRLYKKLKSKNYSDVLVFGFIDNIQELMTVCDIIITKPGGMTISEVLSMELPPIFIATIPGQETQNLKTLAKHGIGIEAKNTPDIKDIVLDYKAHPDKVNKIKENIRKIKKLYALEELYDVVCKGSAGPSG